MLLIKLMEFLLFVQCCMPPPATRLPPFTVIPGSGQGSTPASRYSDPQQSLQWKSGQTFPTSLISVPPAPCNPLEEPSPLGLTLKKTPSLLDLISFQLQHNSAAAPAAAFENQDQGSGKSRIGKCLAPTGAATQDKLKASNFPASSLRIGTWEVRGVLSCKSVWRVWQLFVPIFNLLGRLFRSCVVYFLLQVIKSFQLFPWNSVSQGMKAIWWQSAIMPSGSLCGRCWTVDSKVRSKYSGLTSQL